MIRLIVIGALLALGVVMAYIRYTPSSPADWHLDPRAVPKPKSPNHWLVRPVGGDARPPFWAIDAVTLAQAFDRAALALPRTDRLAGDVGAGHMTYIRRTPWMGFPDFMSVRVHAAEGGASVAIFARSRFGHSDLGYNRAWVDAVLARLEVELGALPAPDGQGGG